MAHVIALSLSSGAHRLVVEGVRVCGHRTGAHGQRQRQRRCGHGAARTISPGRFVMRSLRLSPCMGTTRSSVTTNTHHAACMSLPHAGALSSITWLYSLLSASPTALHSPRPCYRRDAAQCCTPPLSHELLSKPPVRPAPPSRRVCVCAYGVLVCAAHWVFIVIRGTRHRHIQHTNGV